MHIVAEIQKARAHERERVTRVRITTHVVLRDTMTNCENGRRRRKRRAKRRERARETKGKNVSEMKRKRKQRM